MSKITKVGETIDYLGTRYTLITETSTDGCSGCLGADDDNLCRLVSKCGSNRTVLVKADEQPLSSHDKLIILEKAVRKFHEKAATYNKFAMFDLVEDK